MNIPFSAVVSADSTDHLWQQAHAALLAGKWSAARAWLDSLSRRSDIRDELLSLDVYERAAGVELHPTFRAVLSDRIELVNCRFGNQASAR